jgi:hypothetical protein
VSAWLARLIVSGSCGSEHADKRIPEEITFDDGGTAPTVAESMAKIASSGLTVRHTDGAAAGGGGDATSAVEAEAAAATAAATAVVAQRALKEQFTTRITEVEKELAGLRTGDLSRLWSGQNNADEISRLEGLLGRLRYRKRKLDATIDALLGV